MNQDRDDRQARPAGAEQGTSLRVRNRHRHPDASLLDVDVLVVPEDEWGGRAESQDPDWCVTRSAGSVVATKVMGSA